MSNEAIWRVNRDWWCALPKDVAAEIIRTAEQTLDNQLRVAISADQRACAVGAAFLTVAAALGASALALAGSDIRAGALGAGVSALMFLAAAFSAFHAARPVPFHFLGSEPKLWADDPADRPLQDALGDLAEHLQRRISCNTDVLKSNNEWFRLGVMLGILAPALGMIAGAVLLI